MEKVQIQLRYWINTLLGLIKSLPEVDIHTRPAPEKWSKKEIIGHLCDSALNNHSRFVRAQIEQEPFILQRYDQDNWVKINAYQHRTLEEVLDLWTNLNKHILHVISLMPEEKYYISCEIGKEQPVTLQWLIEDYVAHMEHHIYQMVNVGK